MDKLRLLQIQQEIKKEKLRTLYKYCDEFSFTKVLGDAISHLVTKMEGKEYICKVVDCVIKEHEENVFYAPNYPPMDLYLLGGAGISDMNKKHGKYVKETIPEEKIPYFILMEQEKVQSIEQKFSDKLHIEDVLKKEALVYSEYFGVVDIKLFSEYPYLQEFFNLLNQWRFKTNRVGVDEDVIDESVDKVLELLDNQSTTGKKTRQKVNRSYKG